MTDSHALRKWISDHGYKLKYVAEKLGLTPFGLMKKIDNTTQFKVSEIAAFVSELGMTTAERDAIFFAGM